MSLIERLQILGIRSFDNINHEVIKFRGPLTLIVGCNGSGKTTVIECLKYATTGQQPPNSGGGAFIHDPDLCGEKEVMAQVKLQFKTAIGAHMVVSRSLQLTVGKGKRTMKTLEGSLSMVKDGERTALSTRVAELDKIVPTHLGVSKAVLESVIFCHQDDSLWPMSPPQDLKKKFDEIFEALKYSKAVDNIKLLKKNQGIELGKLKIHEDNNKLIKNKGEKVQRACSELQEVIEGMRIELKSIDGEMNVALDIATDKKNRAEEARGIVNELTSNKSKVEFYHEEITQLKKTLVELEDSDEWLGTTLAQYKERTAEYEGQAATYTAQYREIEKSINDSRKELSEKQAQRGQYIAEKAAYENKLAARARLVKEEAHRYEIRGYDDDIDEDQVKEFISILRKRSQDKARELERIKKKTQDELRETRVAVTELENRRTIATQKRLIASQAITRNDKKVIELQREVDSIGVNEGMKAAAEASLQDLQDRLKSSEAEFEAGNWEEIISREKNSVRELSEEETRLRNEQTQNIKFAEDRAQLEVHKKELKKTQSCLDTNVSTYGGQLNSLVGRNWQVDSLEREFQTVVDQHARILTEAMKQQTGAASELTQAEFKLKTSRETLKKKEEEKRICKNSVLNSILNPDGSPLTSLDDYTSELENIEKERNEVQKEIDGFAYVNDFYSKCLATVNSHNKCKLCERSFADKKERSSALEKLNKKLAEDGRAELEKDLRVIEADFQKALAARPQFDRFRALSVEIPALEKELQEAESKRDKALGILNEHDKIVSQAATAKREIEALTTTVNDISRDASTISELEREINRVTSQQKLSGSSLTTDELNEQSDACRQRIMNLRVRIEKLAADKELGKNSIIGLENEVSSAASKLNNVQYQLDKKHSKLRILEELRETNNQERDTIQQADSDLTALIPEQKKANAKVEEAQKRGQAREDDIQSDRDRLAESVNKFTLVEADINKYLENGGSQNLAACQRAIKGIEQGQERLQAESNAVKQKNNEIIELLRDSASTKQNIEVNIRYRKLLRDQERYQKKIVELEERNVTDDHQRLSREAAKAESHYQNLLGKKGPMSGAMRAKDTQLAELLEEWETEYKDAGTKYRESHIKVETTKAAIEDLGKYAQALDNAIMKYHSLKMEQINRIAGELWQNTYQGTDVDTIMIKADNETTNASGVKRNYNYRVVMVKQDAEMDMRGRCSAGQKVLASIIIRLALAECFGANCGIIALDEPTTNLDRDTIRSLAESLHSIIKQRKVQSNFQIIVITHDEEFLKEMKCQDFADNYFRIQRNEKQKSTIEQAPIGDLLN